MPAAGGRGKRPFRKRPSRRRRLLRTVEGCNSASAADLIRQLLDSMFAARQKAAVILPRGISERLNAGRRQVRKTGRGGWRSNAGRRTAAPSLPVFPQPAATGVRSAARWSRAVAVGIAPAAGRHFLLVLWNTVSAEKRYLRETSVLVFVIKDQGARSTSQRRSLKRVSGFR
jgi:hypothetical protein